MCVCMYVLMLACTYHNMQKSEKSFVDSVFYFHFYMRTNSGQFSPTAPCPLTKVNITIPSFPDFLTYCAFSVFC